MNQYFDYIENVYSQYFHLDDPDWVRERKEKWGKAKKALEIMKPRHIRGRVNRYHKKLFLEGKVGERVDFSDNEEWLAYYEAFWAFPIFLMAYHPAPSLERFQEIFDLDWRDVREHDRYRQFLFKLPYPSFDGVVEGGGDYGILGGVEPLLVKTYCPELNPKKRIYTGDSGFMFYSLAPFPGATCMYFSRAICAGIAGELSDFAPGLYLKDHFLWLMDNEKTFSWLSMPDDNALRMMVMFLHGVRGFAGLECNGDVVVSMCHEIRQRFEDGDMPDFMLDYWAQGKELRLRSVSDEE